MIYLSDIARRTDVEKRVRDKGEIKMRVIVFMYCGSKYD